MTTTILHGVGTVDVPQSFISKLHHNISKGLPHAEPVYAFKRDERDLVQGVLQILQGFTSSLFPWDEYKQCFCLKDEIYVSHMSHVSLSGIVQQFTYCGSCLKKVEFFVKKVEASSLRAPTLKAFANSVKTWLKRLRDVALNEEVTLVGSDSGNSITLMGLTNSLSSLCSGAEHLLQVVCAAIPNAYFDSKTSISACELAVHILDQLFKKLTEVCLVQGGEEDAYHMLLAIFTESLLPYLEGLDSWIYEGALDDPYEEMFFYSNDTVSIDQPAFWEMSYLLRSSTWRKSRSKVLIPMNSESSMQVSKDSSNQESISMNSLRGRDQNGTDVIICPVFLKHMARAIVSAGKSLLLVQHVRDDYGALLDKSCDGGMYDFSRHHCGPSIVPDDTNYDGLENASTGSNNSNDKSIAHLQNMNSAREMGVLTLSEVFLLSLAGLVGDGDHIHEYFRMSSLEPNRMPKICSDKQNMIVNTGKNILSLSSYSKTWFKFLTEAVLGRKQIDCSSDPEDPVNTVKLEAPEWQHNENASMSLTTLIRSFCPRNPVLSVCREFLQQNNTSWTELNISRNFHLPPLNDESLRNAIFGETSNEGSAVTGFPNRIASRVNKTDYSFGFQYDEVERLRLNNDSKTLETLFPFPTLLPCIQEELPMSELLPFQKNSTLSLRVINWIQSINLKNTPQPTVVIKECLAIYIKKQVERIGKHILLKLMNDWKLIDELGVLRAIYLLGSGDLLQRFLIVIYDKMDKGDSWLDDFELNTILQESIRNSADGTLLHSPDSLVVSVADHNTSVDEESTTNTIRTHKTWKQSFGIDAFDMLNFTYKVSWPLDLIANAEALKKYNQVMGFLLKVKHAKFVLDKARRWMWKGRSNTRYKYKHHLLVQQKLLHFVDAFHQYVMDRVYHSAWIELCSGMAAAGSLDEVIEVHEAYLLSIQRQCFVAPDKLWALIASRIKSVLGLALDFYSIQQTLSSGGATVAVKTRCEIEMDRIEKQFDDCIAFLLRILSFKLNVGHFPHLVDLVTRINYNYFYMSDAGNLLNVPRFEGVAARSGKASSLKAE